MDMKQAALELVLQSEFLDMVCCNTEGHELKGVSKQIMRSCMNANLVWFAGHKLMFPNTPVLGMRFRRFR